ncbi:alpha/beta hydrolase [Massilia suwonensis]|uniref:Alpha/beta hydrolase n=1 Tax=Massilia suwonensis TaxID=648895 RepID=A0ABW0MRD9_9BURK
MQENPLYAILREHMPGMPERDLPRFAASLSVDEPYVAPVVAPSVPAGRMTQARHRSGQVYPGVERNYTLYVPQQYEEGMEAALMVFQDGARYLGPEANAARVLDALIEDGSMPVTIALFVEPGEQGPGLPVYGGGGNRSVEYDATGPDYVRFLLEELLPQALEGYRISGDPARRAIAGISSGGQCAFNAAWERPDAFGKVLTHCGSFVDIRGGHVWAERIRREEVKALRVFLQSGEHDLDILYGNWLLANREMASALAYRGYDHWLVTGEGGHSLKHGGAMLAETLRWLWRE